MYINIMIYIQVIHAKPRENSNQKLGEHSHALGAWWNCVQNLIVHLHGRMCIELCSCYIQSGLTTFCFFWFCCMQHMAEKPTNQAFLSSLMICFLPASWSDVCILAKNASERKCCENVPLKRDPTLNSVWEGAAKTKVEHVKCACWEKPCACRHLRRNNL